MVTIELTKLNTFIDQTELLTEAIDIIKTLREEGQFFVSCIEFDYDIDGEEYGERVNKFLESVEKYMDDQLP